MSVEGWIKGLVSVIIPTYNRRDFVMVAVESVLAQTYGNVEAIVVDDGSSDGTGEFVRGRCGGDPRVRYVWQDNAERAVARNTGLALARGEFVAFLDSDDAWLPDKLAQQVALLESKPDLVFVFSGFAWINESGTRSNEILMAYETKRTCGSIFDSLLISNVVGSLTVVARHAAVRETGGFSTDPRLIPFAEDWELWLRLAYFGKADYIPRVLALHRVHSGNTASQVGVLAYEVMITKIARYVRKPDRIRVYAQAERYVWGLIDDALRLKDKRLSRQIWIRGLRFIGPCFMWHTLKYRRIREGWWPT
jgi:glycosyltransferase involved in cell wall biosynthesis